VEMNISQIRLYDLFRKKLNLPDDEAAAFVLAVGEVVGMDLDTKKQLHATKDDIHQLALKIEQTKGDLYKAMFVTGIVQLIAILGGVLAIVKFMK